MNGFETGARPTGQEEGRHFRAHLAILIGLLIQFLHALKCSLRVHPPLTARRLTFLIFAVYSTISYPRVGMKFWL